MRQIFQKRSVAWVVYALVAILTIAVAGGSALLRDRQVALDVFYHGENGDELCIDYDLRVAVDTANSLAAICSANGVETTLASDAAPVSSETSIAKRYSAYQTMARSFKSAYATLENKSLTDDQAEEIRKLNAEFLSRETTIGNDAYNDRADQFNGEISAFPANLVSLLRGVRSLEAFR